MNKKEISEIRRRWKPDGNAVTRIYGCYVNANKDIISEFDTSLGLMQEEECEMYMKLLKKVLSGTPGKHLLNLEFSVEDVESAEHALLMRLKDSSMSDDVARAELTEKIINTVDFDESNFLILMAADTYDVPFKNNFGDDLEDGSEVFSYFLCAVCPVKAPQLELKYQNDSGEFHTGASGQVATNPKLGFMYPAFENRSTSIYNAMYYVNDPAELYENCMSQIFGVEPPVSAPGQKAIFESVMEETLKNECSFEVVQAMNEEMRARIEIFKEEKNPEVFEMTVEEIGGMLAEKGVARETTAAFCEQCREQFGEGVPLKPDNIIDTRKFHVETPEIKITVAPENSYLIETKVIDGRKYIMIPADEGVTINGLNVNISEDRE